MQTWSDKKNDSGFRAPDKSAIELLLNVAASVVSIPRYPTGSLKSVEQQMLQSVISMRLGIVIRKLRLPGVEGY